MQAKSVVDAPSSALDEDRRAQNIGNTQAPAWFAFACLLCAGLAVALLAWKVTRSPDIHFLHPRGSAHWIVYPTPAAGVGFWSADLRARFVRQFELRTPLPSHAVLSVAALDRFSVSVNGSAPTKPIREGRTWKEPSSFDVSSLLHEGTNEVWAEVTCDSALPALWLSLSTGSEKIESDTGWSASLVGGAWRPARLASEAAQITEGNELFGVAPRSARRATLLIEISVVAVLAGLLVVGWRWVGTRAIQRMGQFARPWCSVSVVALGGWILAWVILWIHNAPLIPAGQGFDAGEHLKYIDFILTRHALPLASDGFQMYQPPLYYLLGAAILGPFHASPFSGGGLIAIRAIGLFSVIAAVGCVFWAARWVYGSSQKKRILALCFAGLIPFLFYLSYYPSNELFAMALVCAAIALMLREGASADASALRCLSLGVVTGLALLAKTSAIILLPILLVVLPWSLWRRRESRWNRWFGCCVAPIVLCVLVCGWHYARVAAHFGNPFVTNTDVASGYRYWQQPGFATLKWYLPGFEVFHGPFFSSFQNFWDGVYSTLWGDGLWSGRTEVELRPAWNYELMTSGYMLAIVPSLCIVIGLARTTVRFLRTRQIQAFILLAALFLCGLLLLTFSLKTPTYSLCKAFYASGALVSVAVFGGEGADWICEKWRRSRMPLVFLLICWGLTVFAAFWIRPHSVQAELLEAQQLARAERHDLAAAQARKMLDEHPRDYRAARWLCLELLAVGKTEEARRIALQTLEWAPGIADAYLCVGRVEATEGHWKEGIEGAVKATEMAPDYGLAWHARARWEARAGENEAAANDFREAIRVKPMERELHAELAEVLEKLGQSEEAAEHATLASVLR